MKTRNLPSDVVCNLWVASCLEGSPANFYGRKVPEQSGMWGQSGTPGACRIYSEGRVLYSYGRHYVLSVWVPERRLFLVNSDKYSKTTTGQHYDLQRAIGHGAPMLSIPGLTPDPEILALLEAKRGTLAQHMVQLATMKRMGGLKARQLWRDINIIRREIEVASGYYGLPPALPQIQPELAESYAAHAVLIEMAA